VGLSPTPPILRLFLDWTSSQFPSNFFSLLFFMEAYAWIGLLIWLVPFLGQPRYAVRPGAPLPPKFFHLSLFDRFLQMSDVLYANFQNVPCRIFSPATFCRAGTRHLSAFFYGLLDGFRATILATSRIFRTSHVWSLFFYPPSPL